MTSGQIALLVVILTMGAFVSGLSGFGFALAVTPLASMVVAPSRAVVLITLASMLTALQNFVTFRKELDRAVATRMTIASLFGMPLGLIALERLGDIPMRLTIGVVIAVVGLLMLSGIELSKANGFSDAALGFVSGMLNTSTGTNGPPLVVNLRAHRMSLGAFRGTLSAMFVIANVAALGLFGARDRIHTDLVVLALAIYPVQFVTLMLGQRVGRRLGQRRFDDVVIVLLLASAAAAIISAIVKLVS